MNPEAADARAAAAMVDEAGRGFRDVRIVLDHDVPAPPWLAEIGFAPVAMRQLFRREGARPPPGPEGIAFHHARREEVLTVLREVYDEATRAREGETPEELLDELDAICEEDDPDAPRFAEIARRDGDAAGVVLPAWLDRDAGLATNLYVGVAPRWRGRGWGRVLQARGMEVSTSRGAVRFLGSCDTRNEPMIRVFRSLGYEAGRRLTHFRRVASR